MTTAEIASRLQRALLTFCERDVYLLQVDANERSISHKVAEYLQPEFPDWNVDCEYNRDGHTPKVLAGLLREESADGAGNRVFPDIIVHRRGQRGPEGNLLVIEMKKSSDHLGIEADRAKLSAYQNELGYQFGVLLICDVGGDRAVPPFECLWVDGQ
jgi:hypothetical protein